MKKNKIGKYNESNNSDSYEEVIDYETQEPQKEPEPKRHKAIRYIQDYFSAKCLKIINEKPVYGVADYTHIANLYKKGYKPSELVEIIDWYFNTESNPTNLIQLKTCLSIYRINNYKISKKLL